MSYKKQMHFRTFSLGLFSLAVVVLFLAFGGILLLGFIISEEEERDLHHWQARINLIADSRSDAINHWIEVQFSELTSLADNTALRLYMAELAHSRSAPGGTPYQLSYLRNLLNATANRAGFASPSFSLPIDANVKPVTNTGIALLDKNRNVISATTGFPALKGKLLTFTHQVLPGGRKLSPLIASEESGDVLLAFAVPIFAAQTDPSPANQAGMILGITSASHNLFPLLEQPATLEETSESLLVETDAAENLLRYLSPLKDGSPALERSVDAQDTKIASVFASTHPGRFNVLRDYNYVPVLVTGRRIHEAPWTLIHKIAYHEAMADTLKRRDLIAFSGIVSLVGIILLLLFFWRHGASRRYKKLARQLQTQHTLLSLIADHKPEALYIVDEDNTCFFANQQAAKAASITSPAEMYGRSLSLLMPKEQLDSYIQANISARKEKTILWRMHETVDAKGKTHFIQSRHVPLPHLELPGKKNIKGQCVLILEQDVTEALADKARMASMFHAITDTLLALMDKHNANAAGHSAKVAALSGALAETMECSSTEKDTVIMAGKLLNVGKILVPQQLLTKVKKLSHTEKETIRASLRETENLVKDIPFNGPVVDTIRQAYENLDGSGPHALQQETILRTARILRVANDFISMISARAYRNGLSAEEALSELEKHAGTRYDGGVITALQHYLKNLGGRGALGLE